MATEKPSQMTTQADPETSEKQGPGEITMPDVLVVLTKYFGKELADARDAREKAAKDEKPQSADAPATQAGGLPHAPVTRQAPVKNAPVGNPASS